MDRRFLPLCLVCSILVGDIARLQAQPVQPLTAKSVRTAIDGGIKYLLAEQNPNGSWSPYPRQPGGVTALCTLALLNSGVEPNNAEIKRALSFLRKIELNKLSQTYNVSLQTMALCAGEPRDDLAKIQKNVNWLESIQQPEGQWSYGASGGWR